MKQKVFYWAVPIIALGLGIWLAVNLSAPIKPYHAALYPQPRSVADVELVNADGETWTPAALKDQWTLAFTGYTFCPDICPTTMAALSKVKPKLQELDSEHPIRVMFVSVDPKRDTVTRIRDYLQFFDSEFQAVTGPHKALFPFVRSLGLMYSMAESTEKENYLVDHSGSVVIINPQGNVIGRFKPEAQPGQMAVVNTEHILGDMPIILNRL